MNRRIAQNLAAQFSLSTPYVATKTSWHRQQHHTVESPENDHNSLSSLKPSSNLDLLVNQFNNATPENSNDPEETSSSKNYDIEERHNIKIPHKNKSL